ncbi:conserved hypothetical protein [Leishmania major strain Friedlin]|uniref:Uncharacterized protein n=1 Tax=Leishmania major TaxID=5664 RepID=E9AFQ5_LEIMA|nr:conserved hypothetical protein [Leishmania major strain Friedlin]CAG9582786.1 centriole_cartwheel_protein/SAS-6 [Leishmania major strain Friedlin]CBZ13059.1 conserved hypothetical protein [Leishmania major strain Friedlin]|eukprot:XP_003722825.1 conserved hypothetical protein [Leishmania major strain Friedlin]
MINSYHQNSSVVSTEDGSSSTVFGNPRIEQRRRHAQQQQQQQQVSRLPGSYERFSETLPPSSKIQQDPVTEYAARRDGEGSIPMLLRNEGSRSQMHHMEAVESGVAPPPAVRTARTDLPALASPKHSAEEPQTLLETTVMVSTKMPPHEPQVRPLGVYVRTGRGGPNGVTRVVLVRLTDPTDPFFLFELELLEDDYNAFKQHLELLVDFHGFPRYLVGMLRDIADGASAYELSFVLNSAAVGDSNRGTLRVLETTDFKTVEHISLVLLRQGDAGLKRYLAERFQHYEQSFRASEASRAVITAELQEKIGDLQAANDALRASLRKAEEEMRFMMTDAEKEQLVALNRLRDHHTKEMNGARESFDKKVEQLSHALEEKTRQLRDTTHEKDAALAESHVRTSQLEAKVASLQSQLRSAQDTVSVQTKELATLREMNDELANFKAEATKAMSENELNYVTVAERLRGTSTALQSREEKMAALQAHYEKQDEYIRILAEQNRQQADRAHEAEKNLDKAHHIIANQLQAIKNAKGRYHIAMDQLRTQETLLQERDGAARRQQEELTTATERVQELLRKNSDLREQLETTNNAREKLVQEVKLSQQALLRLQQTTSINGRHWGVLSSAYHSREGAAAGVSALNPATGASTADFMREFSAHTQVLSQPGYHGSNLPSRTSLYRSTNLGKAGFVAASNGLAPSTMATATDSATVIQRPSLFAAKAASPSLAHSSQERASSAETAGLTEPHGRASMSSLRKTEPASGAAAASAVQPPVKHLSLDKQSPHTEHFSFNGLAIKSFFGEGDASQRATVTAGPALESAYF